MRPKPTKVIRDRSGRLLVERFSPRRRAEHWLGIISFVTLVVTGFPQKLRGTSSAWLLDALGGLDMARFIHRVSGIIFGGHMAIHLGVMAVGLLMGSMRWSMLPVPQDLRDAWGTLGYYLGFKPRAPDLPKFDYRQKFEYIGLILGGFVMIVSGLVLMFPTLVERFLPGAFIPAAHEMHSNEAMLALLVLAVWHIYGAVLSPEVFPLDTTVFTGYLTVEELHERHALEYKRLFPHGVEELEKQVPHPPAPEPAVPPVPRIA
jgi:formate dehydrogenase gamma subunit